MTRAARVIAVICGATVLATLCGCHGGAGQQHEEQSTFTIMTNAADPLLVTAKASDGRTVEFYGPRDTAGVPTGLEQIIIRGTSSDETVHYMLDGEGRPTQMVAPNGTRFLLEWLSPTEAAVTAVSGDGSIQVNTLVDFSQESQSARFRSVPSRPQGAPKNIAPRGGREVSLQVTTARKPAAQSRQVSAASNGGVCTIEVRSCGLLDPSPASVYVTVRSIQGAYLGTFPAVRVGDGIYQASMPTGIAPKINPQDVCQSVADTLGFACTWLVSVPGAPEYMCAALAAALVETGVGAPAIGTGCLAVVEGLRLYCATLGASPLPGGPSLADKLCQADFLDRTFTSDVEVAAWVSAIPQNVSTPWVRAPGEGPYPQLSVDMGSDTTIRSLTLSPSAPAEGQDYVATADIYCLPAGTAVTLSIIGTDGYSDSTSRTISTSQLEGQFELWVPGAESGVQDVVTLEVIRPDGKTLARTASLVFG